MPFTARFYLKEPSSDSPTLVFLIVKYGAYVVADGRRKYRHFKYSTGIQVLPHHWDHRTCRIVHQQGIPGRRSVNRLLDKYEQTAVSLCLQARADNRPITVDWLRSELDKHFRAQTRSAPFSLLEFWKSINHPDQQVK
jgi:hypothetical protein